MQNIKKWLRRRIKLKVPTNITYEFYKEKKIMEERHY